jgi:hypothetical protein
VRLKTNTLHNANKKTAQTFQICRACDLVIRYSRFQAFANKLKPVAPCIIAAMTLAGMVSSTVANVTMRAHIGEAVRAMKALIRLKQQRATRSLMAT